MRAVTVQQRRHAMVRRHHLAGDARDPDEVTRALVALHATDPASVYLSVLARSSTSVLADVAAAMYERRSLVRWMAMRRTLFVLPRDEVPVVQAAISTPLAEVLRRRLVSQLERNGTEPPLDGETGRWLDDVEGQVEDAMRARGVASGAQLSADVPALRTVVLPGSPSERPVNVTSRLLTVVSSRGRIVRSTPTGGWTNRQHRWEHVESWWPDGIPELATEAAQVALSRRWLERFGPATTEDLQWWMGWTKTLTKRVLGQLPIEDVDLHGEPGIDLQERSDEPDDDVAPVATLLPALDPTPMGWKRREWFFGIDQHTVFDRMGNIGPTVWWDGEIVGGWAVAKTGEVRTAVVADRGAEALAAVEQVAARLHQRLDGTVVTPVFPTELERSLR
ncbi:MAG: hypothetical protein QOC98_1461 [Frankiaceae bacterium]|nr:hypothetical protein [Frankiaceae bacterium]